MKLDDKKTYEMAKGLIQQSCTSISPDVMAIIRERVALEDTESAKNMLLTMLENAEMAASLDKPLCQSPGFPTIYVTFGKDVLLGNLPDIFGQALVEMTNKGYLRPSIVNTITRVNTGDNSGPGVPNFEYEYNPAIDYVEIIISFKGCGAELGNTMKIFTAKQMGPGAIGLKKLVLETVLKAGGIPCPPIGLGIGIGGQMDVAAKLSRKAISVRSWNDRHKDPFLDNFEQELLENINKLGIGPAGIGGRTTALAVKAEMAYTHTAIAPVAISFHCWAARRAGLRIYSDGRTEALFMEGESR
jgi:fumarate hydratase subunit alpha